MNEIECPTCGEHYMVDIDGYGFITFDCDKCGEEIIYGYDS